jgi:glutathione S-transferase
MRIHNQLLLPLPALMFRRTHAHPVASGTGYFCGSTATIADCTMLPAFRMLKSGRLDGIPTTVLDAYPNITAFVDRMHELPAIKAHYAK